MITCIPYGGIGNRLKCIISCLAIFGDIYLKWEIPPEGGVKVNFEDCFTNTFNPNCNNEVIVQSCRFIDEEMNQIWVLQDLEEQKKQSYLSVIKTLSPLPVIQSKIKDMASTFDENTISVSVRTFTCFPAEYNAIGKNFKIENLFSVLDSLDNDFFVTCDSTDVFKKILTRYGGKIKFSPKRTKWGDFTTVEGMQDIIADLYLGGMNKILLGTAGSSFSELQWWFGGCKSEYKLLKLH